MTRFLYIADTHFGADPVGYQQQQAYPCKLAEIVSAACDAFVGDGGVDFVLHGGDMIDATSDDAIRRAAEIFDLPVPVYLCLGNHDLTTPDAVERWMTCAPQLFVGGAPSYTLDAEDCVIQVAPNHWQDEPFFWHEGQRPHLDCAQEQGILEGFKLRPDVPHILSTHCPVFGLPTDQTGFSEPFHAPDEAFTDQITGLVRQHRNTVCVLGAHNHMNMRSLRDGVEYVTVSSLVETPFDVKVFDVTPHALNMTTYSLDGAGVTGSYDEARAFVQGRDCDRAFSLELSSLSESTLLSV